MMINSDGQFVRLGAWRVETMYKYKKSREFVVSIKTF